MKNDLVKLGEFTLGKNSYVAVYNNVSNGVDYLYLNEEHNDVECWTILYSSLRRIVGGRKSVEWFKRNYKTVWSLLTMKGLDDTLVRFQTFERSFWEDIVLNGFENIKVDLFTEEDAENLRNN